MSRKPFSHRLDPLELPQDLLNRLQNLDQAQTDANLVTSTGEIVPLPRGLREFLAKALAGVSEQQSLLLVPEEQTLSTQAAARAIGVSRPYFVRLLDAGKIPLTRVGTHRRVLARDLYAYQNRRAETQKAALTALTRQLDAADAYDKAPFLPPKP